LSFLNYLSKEKDGGASSTPRLEGPLLPQPPTPPGYTASNPSKGFTAPTPFPAIRSTATYDDNYLENRRSGMLGVEERFGRAQSTSPDPFNSAQATSPHPFNNRARSSSPYPFHPDRQDPADISSLKNKENSVNWYYSEYNEQKSEPYIGPGPPEAKSGYSRVYEPHISIYILFAVSICIFF